MFLQILADTFKSLYETYKTYDELLEAMDRLGYMYDEVPADSDEAMLFSRIYTAFRRRAFHKNFMHITPRSSQWNQIKIITDDAAIFAKEYNLDTRTAYIKYLETAESIKVLYPLNRLIRNGERISEVFHSFYEIDNNPNPQLTEAILKEFKKQLLTQLAESYEVADPREYLHFVKAAKLCKRYKLDPRTFVYTLYEGWAWTGEFRPNQLHGTNAIKIMNKESTLPAEKGIKVVYRKVKLEKGFDRW